MKFYIENVTSTPVQHKAFRPALSLPLPADRHFARTEHFDPSSAQSISPALSLLPKCRSPALSPLSKC